MKDVLKYFTSILPDAPERIINAIADTQKYGMWDRLSRPTRELEPEEKL
jgi:hypothetical protein